MARELEDGKEDPEAVMEFGVAYATLECSDPLARGAPGRPLLHAEPVASTRATVASLCAAHRWDRVPEPV